MSDTLRAQLQLTLGDGNTLERELGGGGMSRVFVARETAPGRDVVVKVLAAGASGGMPYYTVPSVKGSRCGRCCRTPNRSLWVIASACCAPREGFDTP